MVEELIIRSYLAQAEMALSRSRQEMLAREYEAAYAMESMPVHRDEDKRAA